MSAQVGETLSLLNLLMIPIDGQHIGNDLVLVAAFGIDDDGNKHRLGVVEGRGSFLSGCQLPAFGRTVVDTPVAASSALAVARLTPSRATPQ